VNRDSFTLHNDAIEIIAIVINRETLVNFFHVDLRYLVFVPALNSHILRFSSATDDLLFQSAWQRMHMACATTQYVVVGGVTTPSLI